tara:strand:+ start:9215 stop:10213 length:999 start_codon:yes stop_codon:yes gene_type:complete
VTGWLLIISLLVLGGLLSTLGDLLGSRVGKARLSIFKLRPKRTAVFITIFTGSLISAVSLSLMLLVSRQLRVGLFELDDLQNKLQQSRLELVPLQEERKKLEIRIANGEKELKGLEKDLIALRSGDVVISSGQSLANTTFEFKNSDQSKQEIESLLQRANLYSFLRIKPGEQPNKRILLVRKDHIERLESIINQGGTWVVNIRSAGNILKGENYVYAFPEVIQNKNIVMKNDIISSIEFNEGQLTRALISRKIKILLSSTLAEVKRRGSLISELQINANDINTLAEKLEKRNDYMFALESISNGDSYTADKVSVKLKIKEYPFIDSYQDDYE